MLDTQSTVETPEGVELTLHPAGPFVRAVAWGIDSVVRIIFYMVLPSLLGLFMPPHSGLANGLMLLAVFFVEWFYPVLFEVLTKGATPGKWLMSIQTVHENGTPVSWSSSMLRNLLRAVDFLPLFYCFGLFAMTSNRRFQRLGDLAAGTLVVYNDRKPKGTAPQLPEVLPEPLPVALLPEEQLALLDFAERSLKLQEPRSLELAELLQPLSGQSGMDGLQRLYRFACGLLGRPAC